MRTFLTHYMSTQSSKSVLPLKAPFLVRGCIRKKEHQKRGARVRPTGAIQEEGEEGSNWEWIGLKGCAMWWGGGDGVGGRAEQTKMPGGFE